MEKSPFYLTKRKLKSGKTIYYYYCYDEYDNRTTPKSTGFSKKNDAFNYCINLFCKGSVQNNLSFEEFSKDWFTEKHPWTKDRKAVRKISSSTLDNYAFLLKTHIKPFFAPYPLYKITTGDLKTFRLRLVEKYSPKTINVIMAVLKIMLGFATECGFINKNPMKSIVSLQEENKREAFTIDEVKYLFSQKWNEKDLEVKLICLVSALTGLRISEALGLQKEQLCDGYINVDRQLYQKKLKETKGDFRFVTIPKKLEEVLRSRSSSPFIFWDRVKCCNYDADKVRYVLTKYYSEDMLKRKKENSLTFHSYRYFFNTYLLLNNINEEKVNFVIGHSSGKGSMMRLYTSWRPEMYEDVKLLQEKLLKEFMVENFLDSMLLHKL